MSTVRSLDVAVRANTQNFEGGMRNVSRALKGAIVGMNAVAGAAAGQEKSILGMINAVAIGFATGGPWGAAIAGVGIGLGMLIGKMKETSEAWDEAVKEMTKKSEQLEKATKSAFDALREQRGEFLPARDLVKLEKEIATMNDFVTTLEDAAKLHRPIIAAGENAPDWLKRVLASPESDRAAQMMIEKGLAQDQWFQIQEAGVARLAALSEQAEIETSLLKITDDRLRSLKQITIETERLVGFAEQMEAAGAQAPGGKTWADIKATFRGRGAAETATFSAEAQFDDLMRKSTEQFQTSLGPAISDGVAAALTDGLATGFKNGADIARSFFAQIAQQAFRLLAMQALGNAAPSLFATGIATP